MLNTALTKLFSLRYPVVLAPMCWGYTSGELAAAVTEAGGLGLFGGVNFGGPEWVREQIRLVRSRTDGAFGVGFITWWLPQFAANFQVCLDERVPVLAFRSATPPPTLRKRRTLARSSSARFRIRRERVSRQRRERTFSSPRETRPGGTPASSARCRVCHSSSLRRLGCLCLRRAASLTAGRWQRSWRQERRARGFGTALLATEDARQIPDSYKQRIVSSDGQDTVFTTLYDTLFDTPFPAGIGVRVAANRFTSEWDGREAELRECRNEVLPTVSPCPLRRHDPDTDPTWMGQSAGAVNGVRPVAEVLQGLSDDAERILGERLSAVLQ